jgi:hypothetical protein
LAEAARLTVVINRCMGSTYGELSLEAGAGWGSQRLPSALADIPTSERCFCGQGPIDRRPSAVLAGRHQVGVARDRSGGGRPGCAGAPGGPRWPSGSRPWPSHAAGRRPRWSSARSGVRSWVHLLPVDVGLRGSCRHRRRELERRDGGEAGDAGAQLQRQQVDRAGWGEAEAGQLADRAAPGRPARALQRPPPGPGPGPDPRPAAS